LNCDKFGFIKTNKHNDIPRAVRLSWLEKCHSHPLYLAGDFDR